MGRNPKIRNVKEKFKQPPVPYPSATLSGSP